MYVYDKNKRVNPEYIDFYICLKYKQIECNLAADAWLPPTYFVHLNV